MNELPSPPLPVLKPRDPASHKGSFGHCLVIGGSRGMSGSVSLAGMAALRTGAGLVTLAVPDRCLETVASLIPCAMTVPLPDNPAGQLTLEALTVIEQWYDRATCIAIGPGLGTSEQLQRLILSVFEHAPCPLVVDADALNNLAECGRWPMTTSGPRVLTPHPGEWTRMCNVPASQRVLQIARATELAKQFGITIVLKGQASLITDGQQSLFNSTGTPAMATGGSGDVLTGVIAALICQGLEVYEAAHLGVYAHGLAGELAEGQLQSHVVLADELVNFLPQAFWRIRGCPKSSLSR